MLGSEGACAEKMSPKNGKSEVSRIPQQKFVWLCLVLNLNVCFPMAPRYCLLRRCINGIILQ